MTQDCVSDQEELYRNVRGEGADEYFLIQPLAV